MKTTYVLHSPYDDWVECVTQDLTLACEYILSIYDESQYVYFNLYLRNHSDATIEEAMTYAINCAKRDTLVVDQFFKMLEDY